jgi:hypothetical protein
MRRAALIVILTLAGCELVDYSPEVGPLAVTPAPADGDPDAPDGGAATVAPGCADHDPAADVSFAADVRPLLSRSPGGCSCHNSGAASGFSLGSYARLRRGGLNSGERIVVAGQPCDSVLVQKLGVAPPFGARMPYNAPPFVTADELTVIKDWIAEGALDN